MPLFEEQELKDLCLVLQFLSNFAELKLSCVVITKEIRVTFSFDALNYFFVQYCTDVNKNEQRTILDVT